MRRRGVQCGVAAIAAAVLALTGCGGGGDEDEAASAAASTATAAEQPDTAEPAAETVAPADAGADCGGLDAKAFLDWGSVTQVLIQVRDQSSLEGVRDVFLAQYSLDEYDATTATMHALLDGKQVDNFGDPKPSLDYYSDLSQRVQAMLAVEGEVPQASFDEYVAAVGEIGEAVGKQLPIGASLEAQCPELAAQL